MLPTASSNETKRLLTGFSLSVAFWRSPVLVTLSYSLRPSVNTVPPICSSTLGYSHRQVWTFFLVAIKPNTYHHHTRRVAAGGGTCSWIKYQFSTGGGYAMVTLKNWFIQAKGKKTTDSKPTTTTTLVDCNNIYFQFSWCGFWTCSCGNGNAVCTMLTFFCYRAVSAPFLQFCCKT